MKEFSLKNYLTTIAVLVGVALVLDLLIPGLSFFGSKIGHQSTASLVVDYGYGRIRQFSGEVIEQMTVLDALRASSQGGLRVEYGKNRESVILFSVDGRSGQLKVKLNGRLVSAEEMNQATISQGDLIKIELP